MSALNATLNKKHLFILIIVKCQLLLSFVLFSSIFFLITLIDWFLESTIIYFIYVPRCLAWDGTTLLVGGAQGSLYLWDLINVMLVKQFEAHQGKKNKY